MNDFQLYLQAVGDYIFRIWNQVVTKNWFLLMVFVIALFGLALEVIHFLARKK